MKSPAVEKSFLFAIRMVRLHQFLIQTHSLYDIARQVIRSGTSIGANIEEAQGGYSKRDFKAKISIAYKEARETHYWLRLLKSTKYIENKLADSLLEDCNELLKILGSILKNTKV